MGAHSLSPSSLNTHKI